MNDPAAPLSPTQKTEFDRRLRNCGYSRGYLSGLLFSRFSGYARVVSVRAAVNHWSDGRRRLPPEFVNEIERILKTPLLQLIGGAVSDVANSTFVATEIDVEQSFIEGKQRLILHKSKERNAKAVKSKKKQVLARTGKLICEACDFDFVKIYGALGEGFAECHHRIPLAELEEDHKTQLDELSIVCSNCHRMLHRSAGIGRMLSVNELRSMVQELRAT